MQELTGQDRPVSGWSIAGRQFVYHGVFNLVHGLPHGKFVAEVVGDGEVIVAHCSWQRKQLSELLFTMLGVAPYTSGVQHIVDFHV